MIKKEVLEKIKNAAVEGKSKEDIYISLLNQGWKVDDINEYFSIWANEKKEEDHKANLQKRTIGIIAIIGAVLIGAGIFSFVASNWEFMTKFVKVVILIITMTVAYASGWLVREKYGYKKMGEALIFLGLLVYGASIFLIGQIFNIRANWPDGFILWMFGSILLTFALDIFIFNYLTIILGVVALIGHPFIIFDRFFSHDPFLLTSSFVLFFAAIILFMAAFHVRKKIKIGEESCY